MNIKKSRRYVYIIKVLNENLYKIGVAKDVNQRLKQLSTGNSKKLKIYKHFQSEFSFLLETNLKNKFSYYHVNGEWFELNEHILANIEDYVSLCEKNFLFLYENQI